MKNSDMPAMPVLHSIDGNWVPDPREEYMGLTKREHFAAMAMQGLLSDGVTLPALAREGLPEEKIAQSITGAAVQLSDALLEALESDKEEV